MLGTAAGYEFIRDAKSWFRYAEAQDTASQTHNRKTAETVPDIAGELLVDVQDCTGKRIYECFIQVMQDYLLFLGNL